MGSMIIRSKFTIISHKSSKKVGYEVLIEQPHFSEANCHPEAYSRLFNFAITFIKLDNDNDELARMVRDKGTKDPDGWHSLSLGKMFEYRAISTDTARDALLTSVAALFRRDYNQAIENLENRSNTLSKSGYFDF